MRFLSFVIIAVIFSVSVSAQTVSKDEQKILSIIQKHLPKNIALLEQLVNVNSGTLNIKGVKKTGDILSAAFKGIGFKTEWIGLPDSLKRAGHLVASHKGTKGKKVLLIGHLDTVFEPDMPANPYKKLNDSTATGQGVNDMKGGDIIMFAALEALHEAGLLNDANITAYFTGDEEKAGEPSSVSRADFMEKAKQHDVALAFEGAQGLHTVAVGRRGSSSWTLSVTANQGHSAGIFRNNYGAIYEAARIINTFREQLSNEKYITFNPGLFSGGTDIQHDSSKLRSEVSGKTNIISPLAIVQGDLRFLTEEQKENVRARMRTIATTNNLAGTTASITFKDGIPGMEPTEGNNKLVTLLDAVSRDLGLGEVKAGDPGSRGAGDISYIAKYLDCIDGLGATGAGSHAPGETINLNDLKPLIERTALLIYRLIKQ